VATNLARAQHRCASTTTGCLGSFRPIGFTDNLEGGNLENRALAAPPGGLDVSHLTARLTVAPPTGQDYRVNLVEAGTTNVFLSCTIVGPSSTCDSADATATVPGYTPLIIVPDISYSVAPNPPYLDISWESAPPS
jgi:hypothetical protein